MKEPSSGRIFPGHSSLGTPELGRGFCTLLGVDHTSLARRLGHYPFSFAGFPVYSKGHTTGSTGWHLGVSFPGGTEVNKVTQEEFFSIYSVFTHTTHVKVGKHPSRDERKADNSGVLYIIQAQQSVSRAG